jgi:predicted phage tail protein
MEEPEMPTNEQARLTHLEVLANTILLAIQHQSQIQQRTQQQLDQFQSSAQQQMDDLRQQVADIGTTVANVARQQELNAEQIAANVAGLVELRNILADYIRARG